APRTAAPRTPAPAAASAPAFSPSQPSEFDSQRAPPPMVTGLAVAPPLLRHRVRGAWRRRDGRRALAAGGPRGGPRAARPPGRAASAPARRRALRRLGAPGRRPT